MTNEELNKTLYEKCDREFEAFLDEVNKAFTDKANGKYPLEYGDEFLFEYAYQYTVYGDILTALEEMNLSDEQCNALLDNPNPLFSIYDEWLDTETEYMDSIRDCILFEAEKEVSDQSKEKDGQSDRQFDNLEFRLGLYNQFCPAYSPDTDEGRAYGIALQAYENGEPYGVVTVNLPGLSSGICEFIGIKNAVYMDTNNYPWINEFLEKGVAVDTGFTKRSGFCEYPLFQFDENWLKSLKPVVADRTYDTYEKKYNSAMGIENAVDEKETESITGRRVRLIHMEGENPERMFSGLEGTINHIDDIGQIHVDWDNGSSLALNEDVDEFVILETTELSKSLPEEQKRKITVLEIEPGKEPEVIEIETGLESLQDRVGGLIECVYPWDDEAAIIVNEEGKIMGLPFNRALRDDEGNIYDAVAGTMLIVGLTEDDFGSLSSEQIEKYTGLFREPETIFVMDREVRAFPSSDISQMPVYLHNAEYAYNHRETDAYRLSYGANIRCKEAIQKSLSENYNNTLNTDKVWKEVTDVYGRERVAALLAQTCTEMSHDGRISGENKKWAASVPVPVDKFIIEKPHIGLVDLLAARAGKETVKEKTSVLEKLEQNKVKAAKSTPNKPIEKNRNEQDISLE